MGMYGLNLPIHEWLIFMVNYKGNIPLSHGSYGYSESSSDILVMESFPKSLKYFGLGMSTQFAQKIYE